MLSAAGDRAAYQPSTDTISRVPLFSGLEKRDLERIANSFKERRYKEGDAIATASNPNTSTRSR